MPNTGVFLEAMGADPLVALQSTTPPIAVCDTSWRGGSGEAFRKWHAVQRGLH